MNKTLTALLLAFAVAAPLMSAHAAETTGEKVEATGKTMKREGKKALHRTQEAVCMEGDVKCAAKKAANRVEEGKDATVDKAKEVKNKVD